ncbi:hypothetical protein [Streptomyces sp. MBT53]|uniref:hypothetical protein n=1 Tax=Streptomyces sp. MBT53 TaxID=1488384 RepID=UPI001F44FE15|nr:hypothetical protein [Streptomyces sp. MBT53]
MRRLGDDWVGAVADQDRRREQQQTPRTVPPTAREQKPALLELELIPTRPQPYEPWREPLTPQRRAHNWRLLELALTGKAPRSARRNPPKPRSTP